MRVGFTVIAMASLAAFIGAIAESADAQSVQVPDAAVVKAPATPAATTQEVPVVTTTAQQQPAAIPEAAAVGPDSALPATTESPETPGDAAASQSITLKMATVPPPAEFKVPAGYRPVVRGLDTVYCTSITPTGSRMPQTYCLTKEQVVARERQAEVDRRDVAQKSNVAGTPSGP